MSVTFIEQKTHNTVLQDSAAVLVTDGRGPITLITTTTGYNDSIIFSHHKEHQLNHRSCRPTIASTRVILLIPSKYIMHHIRTA